MPIKSYKPTSPGRRGMTVSTFEEITQTTPEKSLLKPLKKRAGRNFRGKITVRRRGGGSGRAQTRRLDPPRHSPSNREHDNSHGWSTRNSPGPIPSCHGMPTRTPVATRTVDPGSSVVVCVFRFTMLKAKIKIPSTINTATK